jgi:hypothetical protein
VQLTIPRRVLITCVLTAAIAAPAAGQSDQLPALAPQCPAGAAPVMDTSTVTVALWPAAKWKDKKYSDAQQLRMRYYADGIRGQFVAPRSLGELPILGEVEERKRKSDDGSRSVVRAGIVLVVTPEGRTKTVAWEQVPLSVPLAAALANAVRAADSLGAFDGIPREPEAGDTLLLTLDSRRNELPRGAVPLLRAQVTGYVVERGPLVSTLPTPEFPESARRNFARNKGVVAFIVGTGGRAYMPSFQLTRNDWADFEPPIRAAIAAAEFVPARSGGCRVPQLGVQPFDFNQRPNTPWLRSY